MNTYFKLPEKWCIRRSPENYKELNPLLKQVNGKIYTGTGENMYRDFDYFHNIPFKRQTYIGSRQYNYVKITLEQLKNSLTHTNIMENFAIKVDLHEPLFREFIDWINKKYNRGFIGINGYYGINEGEVFHTVSRPDEPLVSLEYWNENIRNKKIIGYRLIKPEYKEPASTIGGFLNFGTFENFKTLTFPSIVKDYVEIVKKLEDAGVLNIWFEPVYLKEKELPIIGGHTGEVIDGSTLKYGCQTVDISLFDIKKCNLEEIKINSVTVGSMKIDQITVGSTEIDQIRNYLIDKGLI